MCAVAFWGDGAKSMVSTRFRARIICNLASGGTNPAEIERLGLAKTRQMDDLHAKVYIGRTEAVVTSANASANGLGLEGIEQAKWREAGFLTSDVEPLKLWFEKLWSEHAREITPQDVVAAKIAWNKRRLVKPRLLDFGDFDPNEETLPLINWISRNGALNWQTGAIEEQIGGKIGEDYQERIDQGLAIEHENDIEAMTGGRWVFVFTRKANGLVATRPEPYWTYLKGFLKKVVAYDGDNQILDWALRAESVPPPPFDLNPRFISAFSASLAKDEYEPIRRADYPVPYFSSLDTLMRDLWRDTHALYVEDAAQAR